MSARYAAWGVCAGSLLVFIGLAWQIEAENSALLRWDENTAVAMKEHATEHPALLHFARLATHAGGTTAMTALAIIGALVLLRWRQPALAAIWLLAAVLGGTINQESKALFDRTRPGETLRDEAVKERNASFPSGHAMGSTIGYGTIVYVGMVLLRRRWAKIALTALVALLLLVIGWTRIYLRAHWCSDVLGGWTLGLSVLSLCIAVAGRGGRGMGNEKKSNCPVTTAADGSM
jgi:PAP2 superfamily